MTLTVVKVGGSFVRYPRLDALAAALARGAGRAVIVPGGGPYADLVRKQQKRVGFADSAAHRMALLAMAEFGYALSDLSEVFVPAASIPAVEKTLGEGGAPVWLPLDLLDGASDVPESWEMTSDSLAAWLARRLSAAQLVYLKRRAPPRAPVLADLVAAGLLDPLVPRFLPSGIDLRLCGPRDFAALGRALAGGEPAGRRIAVA